MVQLQFIEQTGHGVPLIVSKYGKEAFNLSDNFITVTIPLSRENEPVSEPVSEPVKLTKSARLVFDALKENADLTIDELAAKLGMSRETVKRALKLLRDSGYIERIGSDKSGYWSVIKQ